jgi:hypothetical protein
MERSAGMMIGEWREEIRFNKFYLFVDCFFD